MGPRRASVGATDFPRPGEDGEARKGSLGSRAVRGESYQPAGLTEKQLVCRYFNNERSVKSFTKRREIVNFFTFAAFFAYFLFISKKPCILQKLGL